MHQIALLPSGNQVGNVNTILYYGDDYILYASSLAVYVLNPITFQVIKILSCTQKSISAISVCPLSKNLIAVSSIDGSVAAWQLEEEQILSKAFLNTAVSVVWDPFDTNNCAIISLVNVRLLLWSINKSNTGLTEVFSVRSESLKPVLVRWSQSVQGLLVIGCNSGTAFLFNTKDKTHKVLQHSDKKADVVDIQWDRLSTSYLLIAYTNTLLLWDSTTLEILMNFEKQPLGISAIGWMEWTAGNFVSANGRNSHLKIWNASQKTSIRSVKVPYNSSITGIAFNANQQRSLLSFHDGTVAVYDLERNRFDYKSQPGHTETIFAMKISPTKPDVFATGSYDGTVKIWDMNHLTVVRTLYGIGEFIYSLDWSLSGRVIAASMYSGTLFFWNPKTGRELLRLTTHTKSSYCVEWNPSEESLLLSTSADFAAVVHKIEIDTLLDSEIQNIAQGSAALGGSHSRGKSTDQAAMRLHTEQYAQVKYKFFHPAPVFGCAWNRFKSNIFCSACQDGIVRVFNIAAKTLLSRMLLGHGARAFSCSWSPLVPGLLATGGDDYQVMVWDVDIATISGSSVFVTRVDDGLSIGLDAAKNDSDAQGIGTIISSGYTKANSLSAIRVLVGHKSFVRALTWNYENKHLLLSGSWDASIRVWNVVTGACLMEINDHVADVYALVSHPLRPFTYLSCSRDTTVRVWEMEGIFRVIRYYCIWDEGFSRTLNNEENRGDILSPRPSVVVTVKKEWKEDKDDDAASNTVDRASPTVIGSNNLLSLEETMNEFASMPIPSIATTSSLSLQGRRSHSLQEEMERETKRNAADSSLLSTRESKEDYNNNTTLSSRSSSTMLTKKSIEDLIYQATRYYKIYSFFSHCSGSIDLMEVALQLLLSQLEQDEDHAVVNIKEKGKSMADYHQRRQELEAMITNLIRSKELRKVFAEQEIIPMAYSELNKLQMKKDTMKTSSLTATATSKREVDNSDALQEQMMIFQYIKLQDYEKAIHLLVEHREWDLALTLAPMVSYDHWKELSGQYGEYLLSSLPSNATKNSQNTQSSRNWRPTNGVASANSNSLSIATSDERCIPYLLISGHYDTAIQYYLNQQDFSSAKIISQMMSNNNDKHKNKAASTLPSTTHLIENRQILREMICKSIVAQFLGQGQSILAAAELLANQEVDLAIDLLFKCGEIDLAYCLSRCFSANTSASLNAAYDVLIEEESKEGGGGRGRTGPSLIFPPPTTLTSSTSPAIASCLYLSKQDRNDFLLTKWADRCASYHAMDLALNMLLQLSNADQQEIEIALLLAKHSNETRCRKLIQQFNLKPLTFWSQLAKEQEAIGSDEDAILYHVLSRQYHKAVTLSIPYMKKYLRTPWEFFSLSTQLKPSFPCKIYHILKSIRLKEIQDENLRLTYLSQILWYSAHESWLLGLFSNANYIFTILLSNSTTAEKYINIGVTREEILFQKLFTSFFAVDLTEVMNLVKELINEMNEINNQAMKENLQKLFHFVTVDNYKGWDYWVKYVKGVDKNNREGEKVVGIIIKEIQSFSSSLSLPSIFHLNQRQSSNHSPRSPLTLPTSFSSDYDFLQRLLSIPQPVVLGSSLPVANQKLKQYRSYLSLKRIQGSSIPLDQSGENSSYLSFNEAVHWHLVNPYSPRLNGDFLFL